MTTSAAAIFRKSKNRAVVELHKMIERLAATDIPILIIGETGTGKEVVAESIHAHSLRRTSVFMKINCAAYPETIFDSELFGHEKGAFTGASDRKAGLIESARQGTLLLDEIGDMPTLMQAKILRVADGRSFMRIGGRDEIKPDIRLLSATHKDIARSIENGEFREDLYHRLAGAVIRLPALRDRPEDIIEIARTLLLDVERQNGRTTSGFDDDCMLAISNYRWPGNFREMRQRIQRAVVLTPTDEKITVDALFGNDLTLESIIPITQITLDEIIPKLANLNLEKIIKKVTIEALRRADFEQKGAAAQLGITPRAINYYIDANGITHEKWKKNSPQKVEKEKEQ